jgi:hypothetical protein
MFFFIHKLTAKIKEKEKNTLWQDFSFLKEHVLNIIQSQNFNVKKVKQKQQQLAKKRAKKAQKRDPKKKKKKKEASINLRAYMKYL